MTTEELKVFFNQPLMILVMMFVAALLSAAKQLVVARRGGSATTLKEYFFKIETVIMLVGVIGSWITMIFTDTMSILGVLAGYVANDVADVGTKDGRSGVLSKTEEVPKDAK